MWSSRLFQATARRSLASSRYGSGVCYRLNNNAVRFFSSKNSGGLTIGIMRETYDPWERRTPLCPHNVEQLISSNAAANTKVLVQPSSQRVFPDHDYESAGAVVSEDLSDADVILGVKRPKDENDLLANKAYMFFSHVIKGQPENMGLLQNILDNQVQLVDYECIAEQIPGTNMSRRLVAFGKYAGLAGIINTLYPLGRRIMSNFGLHTPFLYCPTATMHQSLEQAKDNIRLVGEKIKQDGLPSQLEPLVICVTGTGGNVHNGVMEILKLLPHEILSVEDLAKKDFKAVHSHTEREHKIYVVTPHLEDIYQHVDGDSKFDFQDFLDNPSNYNSTFRKNIAPYVHAIVNCVYWDPRYARLLTKEQVQEMQQTEENRLLLLSDISCDIHGSIEFLEKSTTIDKPYFNYDPLMGRVTMDDIGDKGITVMAVDILPTELPKESSEHFGEGVTKIMAEVIDHHAKSEEKLDMSKVADTIAGACITTTEGALMPRFEYIRAMMNNVPQEQEKVLYKVHEIFLSGHLFDSGLINQILDVVEKYNCHFEFEDCRMGKTTASSVMKGEDDETYEEHGFGTPSSKSSAILRIAGKNESDIEKVEQSIQMLVEVIPKAQASMKILETYHTTALSKTGDKITAIVESPKDKNVLLLGAGMVSESLVRYLGKKSHNHIMVVSDNAAEAYNVAKYAKSGKHEAVDVINDNAKMTQYIDEADVVISLLPATMHPQIAEKCIKQQTNLVTASYESDAMRLINAAAQDAGVRIVNEVGLDPGLDHMSAMKIIDDIHARGGTVTCFKSVCGGLPAPEAADNPLKYKFSWSPAGVISASQNDARYRIDNRIVEVDGNHLLDSSQSFTDAWTDEMQLECLPNRDSLHYENIYNIQDVKTLFRGTLRYKGFSPLLACFKRMGFFEKDAVAGGTKWNSLLQEMAANKGYNNLDNYLTICAKNDEAEALRLSETLRFLGLIEGDGTATTSRASSTLIDAFCDLLQEKLQFGSDERDMVLMHHDIRGVFDDGTEEYHTSSLQVYGDHTMSAMCRTVGTPAAVVADLLMNNKIGGAKSGLLLPTSKSIYLPTLEVMQNEGIVFHESMTTNKQSNKQKAGGAAKLQQM